MVYLKIRKKSCKDELSTDFLGTYSFYKSIVNLSNDSPDQLLMPSDIVSADQLLMPPDIVSADSDVRKVFFLSG